MSEAPTNPRVEPGGRDAGAQDYDAEIKRAIAEYLESELNSKSETTADKISKEKLADIAQRRNLGKYFALVAAVVPLLVLLVLLWQICAKFSAFGNNDTAVFVFISASFLCFIVIYAVLIKGMFQKHGDESEESPIAEAMQILRNLRSGGE